MVFQYRKRYKHYSRSFKKSILKKVLTGDRTLASLCREHGFGTSSYYYWLKQEREQAGLQMKKSGSKKWNMVDKLNAIKVTASMTSEEKAAWCRSNGTYVQEIENWEKEITEILKGNTPLSKAEKREERQELNKLKNEVKILKRDLNRKDKALAETAARLILKKRLEDFLSGEEE